MAERKAVNKYYPPDWDPRKGSVNKRVGQHPLRDRAKKLSQGILVIRFELPYNIWCGGCGIHIGMGVRYNAEKSKVGNYYTTPIYKFRMKCHLCDNYFEIQTDPKNHDYVILNGARRKEQRWDPVANGQIVPEDKATQKKLATDPMYKLEHGSDDHQKGKEQVSSLAELEEGRISMIDDYLLNRMARDKFRSEKKQLREAAEAERAILDKSSLDIDLVEESEEDKRLAGLLKYSVTTSFEEKQRERRKSIEQRPIFREDKNQTASSSGSSSVSSSSTLLSQHLPYQRHARPMLSRRGELKQKLGWAIKASYKDPFKSTDNKREKISLSNPARAIQRQLGIKLKSVAQNEPSHPPDSQPLLAKNKSTVSNKTSQPSKDENLVSKFEKGGGCPLETAESKYVPSGFAVLPNSDSPSDISKNHSCEPSKKSLSDSQSTCDVTLVQADSTFATSTSDDTGLGADLESSFNTKIESPACDESDKEGSSSYKDSNSGLQTLMSSYGDSDSDSTD